MKWRVFLTALALVGGGLALAADRPTKSTANHIVYLEDSRPVLIRVHVEIDGKPLQVAWEDFLDGLFKDADADKNGTLEATEVARLPALETLFPNTRIRFFEAAVAFPGRANTLAAMDGNKDGKVSRDELAAYFRTSGATPFQMQFGGQDPFEQRRLIARGGGGAMPSADTLNDALFKALDTDKDGKLSRSELLDAPALLAKLDADDDEVLTAQEVVQQPPPSGYEQFVVLDGMPQQPANNPFVAVRPGEPAAALARQILARYAKGDKAKAKKVGRDDLKLDDKAFAALDADEDGELDAEELARFASREPDVEIVLRLGKTRKPAREIVSPAPKEPPGPHDPVNVEVGNTRLNLRVTLPNSGPTAPATPADRFKMQFTAADTDGNGYLEMKEVENNRFFSTQFKTMDADNDGKVFLKEMLAFFERQESVQKRAMASCVTVTASDQGKGILDLMDTVKDGRLGLRELRRVVDLLKELDRDGDGSLSRNEIPRSYSLAASQGISVANQFAGAVAVRAAAGEPERPPAPTNGPLWFRKMDRNRDGDVSRREFLGTEDEFRRMDADGDGLISLAEAEKVDSDLRKTAASAR